MKIRFNSNDKLKKGLEKHGIIIIIRYVIYNNKYYPQTFIDEYLHKLI